MGSRLCKNALPRKWLRIPFHRARLGWQAFAPCHDYAPPKGRTLLAKSYDRRFYTTSVASGLELLARDSPFGPAGESKRSGYAKMGAVGGAREARPVANAL